jgi:putative tricarboxylic transport membrane protein
VHRPGQIRLSLLGLAFGLLVAAPADAEWQPRKSIEFVSSAGGGGGTDQFARTVQAIIVKHRLIEPPITVVKPISTARPRRATRTS